MWGREVGGHLQESVHGMHSQLWRQVSKGSVTMAYAEVTYDYNTHSVYPTKMLHQFLQNVNVFVMYAMFTLILVI